mmetsp:Transcript_7293/g.12318  ORF Transcript_7293/g.12318 Transcript_7293/m.12318 type:complete len:166 (+) Transcript_7293:51-548(+)
MAKRQMLLDIEYDPKTDFNTGVEDSFGPITEPTKDLVHLDTNAVNYQFIGQESDIDALSVLIGAKVIGVDAEWRPSFTQFERGFGPAIIQISSYTHAFIVDIFTLKQSEKLDLLLSQIFSHPDTIIAGFSFHSDLSMFRDYHGNMKFIQTIPQLLDLQSLYRDCS